MAAENPPDAVLGDSEPAPLLPGKFGRDAPRPAARMGQGEGQHALLDVRANLIGHPWAAALADPQRLKPPAVDLLLPAVIGRVVHAHRPARRSHADLRCQREQPQAIAEQDVIIRHANFPPS